METESRFDVFISYPRSQLAPVTKIVERLESKGMVVWVDYERSKPGMDWEREVRKAITNSSLFIPVACPEWLEANNARGEIHLASETEMHIVPVWIDGEKFSKCIDLSHQRLNYIDARDIDKSEAAFEAAIDKICQIIEEKGRVANIVPLQPISTTLQADSKVSYKEEFWPDGWAASRLRGTFYVKLAKIIETAHESLRIFSFPNPKGVDSLLLNTEGGKEYINTIEGVVDKHAVQGSNFSYTRIIQRVIPSELDTTSNKALEYDTTDTIIQQFLKEIGWSDHVAQILTGEMAHNNPNIHLHVRITTQSMRSTSFTIVDSNYVCLEILGVNNAMLTYPLGLVIIDEKEIVHHFIHYFDSIKGHELK